MQLYCDVAECDDPKNPGHPCPVFRNGKCSTHTKQLQRTGKTTAITPQKSLKERIIDEAGRMAEAGDDDEEYDAAERNVVAVAKQLGRIEVAAAIRHALAAARARGVRLGRPPKANAEEVRRVYRVLRNGRLTAEVLRLGLRTVRRYLSVPKTRISAPPRSALSRPRSQG